MQRLAMTFYDAYRGARADGGAHEPLEAALRDLAARGRAAWPEVGLDAAVLAAHLGERAPADASPLCWLAGTRAEDFFLACAAAEGIPAGMRAFDEAFLDKIGLYLRSLRPSPELVAETRQALLERLFVGSRGGRPKIRCYSGQGALGAWVRVTALRTALNLLDRERADSDRADEARALAQALAPAADPEIDLMRAHHVDAFVTSLRESLAGLPRRERCLLRLVFVERLTPGRIGVMYGVHRTTAMRWIDAAQQELVARTRARVMERLHLSPSECGGVLALVMSRLDVTLGSLFKTGS